MIAWGLGGKTDTFTFEIQGNGDCAAYLNSTCDRSFTAGPIGLVLSYETSYNKGLFPAFNDLVLSSVSITCRQNGCL